MHIYSCSQKVFTKSPDVLASDDNERMHSKAGGNICGDACVRTDIAYSLSPQIRNEGEIEGSCYVTSHKVF